MIATGNYDKKLPKRRKGPWERISGGLISCLVWGAVGYVFHWGWVVFPLVFMGVLPLISGMRRLASEGFVESEPRAKPKKLSAEDRRRQAERSVLRLASERGGRLSPALVSIETGLSLDEAQEALDAIVGKGHAELKILDTGRLEYAFPEFERELGTGSRREDY